MGNRYRLSELGNDLLVAALSGLVRCRSYPEAFVRVAEGELQLSVLSLRAQYLKPDTAAELFDACSPSSVERVELLLAARFPKPDVAI